jgi:UDP-N-acetylglucosamine--N-acetylmuramyl-(pentapeptide) pyrophosphoryl-undecaprenol N-acetylglucosamine transferase
LSDTYVIAGGYSAGHLTPGLAVAEALRVQRPDLNILFAGSAEPAEAEFVRAAGISFLALPGVPWVHRGPLVQAQSVAAIAPALWIARRKFKAASAVGLLSLGSFAAIAPALAARSLGLPVIIFEPNASLGLAHRVIRPFARQVLASRLFDPHSLPPGIACAVVGVPLRSALGALAERTAQPPAGELRLLVLGGSLGDSFLNERVPSLAARLGTPALPVRVTHQCGRRIDPAAVRAAYLRNRVKAVVERFLDPIAPALRDAHFIIAAAGAVTIHEIAAAGVPVLIVPLDSPGTSHEQANAEAFCRVTGCLRSTQENWNEVGLAGEIAAVVGDRGRWLTQSRALRLFAGNDAGVDTITQILASLRAP